MADRKDPMPAFHFGVKLMGGPKWDYKEGSAMFRSVSGLKIDTETVDQVEGGWPIARKVVNATKTGPLELKDGFAGDEGMFRWVTKPSRCDVVIVQLGPGMKEVARWTARNAFPSKWEGPTYDAAKNELAIQSLTVVYERLESGGGEAAPKPPQPRPSPPAPAAAAPGTGPSSSGSGASKS